jgi:phosphoenolpyruvate phosphomutase
LKETPDMPSIDLPPEAAAPGRPSQPLSKFARLREVLTGPSLSFLMEAHNGLSAKIAEEAGFQALWGSGLTISASLGLRDSNEASWTQVLDVLEYMADAASIPILVDGDTGYGNFNNVRRLVRKLGERGVAGVCIEDKLFPKTNSFLGEAQPLADIEEFCGRLRAAKDSQTDDDFTVVARVEALISGRGMEEALRRAEAYHEAGADAILIHSKLPTASEILDFTERWGRRSPVVIVPTMYYATPTESFRRAGINAVIWANHLLRSSISAMRATAQRIHDEEGLLEVEGRVASVKDIFSLTANAELEAAERRYLPATKPTRAIILAAAGQVGSGDQPKCLADIRGRSLLRRQMDSFAAAGVRDISVVRGYGKAAVTPVGAEVFDNDRYAETGEVQSLIAAESRLKGEVLVSYGDILFRNYILTGLLATPGDIVVAVDALGRVGHGDGRVRDLVAGDRPPSPDYIDDPPPDLAAMGPEVDRELMAGEWIGLVRFSAQGSVWLGEEIERMRAEGVAETADMPLLLTRLAARHQVKLYVFSGHWLDVDTLPDLAEARNFT